MYPIPKEVLIHSCVLKNYSEEVAFGEENPIKVHPNIIYSTFCGSRMFLFSVSPLSRNL